MRIKVTTCNMKSSQPLWFISFSTYSIVHLFFFLSSKQYLSITLRLSSSFLVKPLLPELMQMKEWFNANKEDLKNLFEPKAYNDPTILLPLPREKDILTIKTAQEAFETNQLKAVWIHRDTMLVADQTKFWYTSCVNCQKAISADVDWTITCPSCKEYAQTQVRCRISITLIDLIGALDSVIFGEDAEKLIPFTAAKFKAANESSAFPEAMT